MKASAEITCPFQSEASLRIVLKALRPEVEKSSAVRSTVSLAQKDTYLVLRIEAKDTVALRATLNAYLRWIGSMITVLEVLKKF
jgi:tRNA threonylcarbamoyladenosine modification (KEOPS) complex  Pcc1 subunit